MAETECAVDGCRKETHCRGLCAAHYRRWRLYGDPMAGGPLRPRGFVAGLTSKFLVGDGCWEWMAAKDRHGYGHVWAGTNVSPAHRVVYEWLAGPIPGGLELDHLCRNRACVRPDHLEPVTHAENVRRGAASKTHCPQGHPYDDENTYYGYQKARGAVARMCKACRRRQARERYVNRKAAA